MEGLELIKLGDEMQDDGIERLLRMNKDMDLNNQKVGDINQELQTQNEKMMAAEETVKDIESTLKRARKLIAYFSEEFYKDKCIRILVSLIIVVLIAICVTFYIKKKNGSSTSPVTTTGASTNSTSTGTNATNPLIREIWESY